ncbi:MAG: GNAT family N-acetyltransferase [Gemmatimonadota bacterium]|jgi:ribosomal protein S18 acetylase RimI-like enzyme
MASGPRVWILEEGQAEVLERVEPGVFDRPLDPRWTAVFLQDPRHHLAVAVVEGVVVGIASGVDYVHPDKPPELWVNEIAVAPGHRGAGLGRRLLERLLDHGRTLGCRSAWVVTEEGNAPARALFRSAGGVEPEGSAVLVEFDLTG